MTNQRSSPQTNLDPTSSSDLDSTNKRKALCRCVSMTNAEASAKVMSDSACSTTNTKEDIKEPLHKKLKQEVADDATAVELQESSTVPESVESSPTSKKIKIDISSYSHNGLNPNIAYVPLTSLDIPNSPMRSVVSCDYVGEQSDPVGTTGTTNASTANSVLDKKQELQPSVHKDVIATPIRSNLSSAIGLDADTMFQAATGATPAVSQEKLEREQNEALEQELQQITTDISKYPQHLQLHLKSLRIESSLQAMKPLLHKLLTHQQHNRRGTFNSPVDYIAWNLKDYLKICPNPMDLGAVKTKLYSNVYHSHIQVAKDIRLTFDNAMRYNPPKHPVHEAASALKAYFEEGYAHILAKSAPPLDPFYGLALPPVKHQCKTCNGKTCPLCNKGCRNLEPNLLICAGSACSGTKIRKNISYYCTPDGTKTWCQRCWPSLPAILPRDDDGDVLYKKDLIKRKNEEDVVERWIDCSKCTKSVHQMCAFVNEFDADPTTFVCPLCMDSVIPPSVDGVKTEINSKEKKRVYSFVTGQDLPEEVEDVNFGTVFDARTLEQCSISDFMELKVKQRMQAMDCPKGSEATVTIRVISDNEKEFGVPDVVLRHFRKAQEKDCRNGIKTFEEPPSSHQYRSKAVAMFQRIDGMDVMIFCMYVQEYEGADGKKRVYLAYIDSVDHFRPRCLRSAIYHEILAAYFATARARGFSTLHIWASPPSRGNSFVLWTHPDSQRTPTKERLQAWYHNVISHSINHGIITDVKSLYEESFEDFDKSSKAEDAIVSSTLQCPALLEGDFWIEEASRVYSSSQSRWSRSNNKKPSSDNELLDSEKNFLPHEAFKDPKSSRCPAIHVSVLLENCIMAHKDASPFLRPVNAAALKLKDYHDVIKNPMDLGTIFSQCMLGEYDTFQEIVEDLKLVFNNAMRYNPQGHPIHNLANNMWDFVQKQLAILTKFWDTCGIIAFETELPDPLAPYYNVSMRLSSIIVPKKSAQDQSIETKQSPSVTKFFSDDTRSKLLFEGPVGIAKLMAGEDTHLLTRRSNNKEIGKKKKKSKKRKESICEAINSDGIRRESWLSFEVLGSIRNNRSVIFVCHLEPKKSKSETEQIKLSDFQEYIKDFDIKGCPNLQGSNQEVKPKFKPSVQETRHGLLEFSQYGNLQFDTVRRAKYSTAMLLYYFKNPHSDGVLPKCSDCKCCIENVRWHRINKAFDERRRTSQLLALRTACFEMARKELCGDCYLKSHQKEDFYPIRVSFRAL